MKKLNIILATSIAAALFAGASVAADSPTAPPSLTVGKPTIAPPTSPPKADPREAACKSQIASVRDDIKLLVTTNKTKMNKDEREKFAEIDRSNDANFKAVQRDGLTVEECNAALKKFQEERVTVRGMIKS